MSLLTRLLAASKLILIWSFLDLLLALAGAFTIVSAEHFAEKGHYIMNMIVTTLEHDCESDSFVSTPTRTTTLLVLLAEWARYDRLTFVDGLALGCVYIFASLFGAMALGLAYGAKRVWALTALNIVLCVAALATMIVGAVLLPYTDTRIISKDRHRANASSQRGYGSFLFVSCRSLRISGKCLVRMSRLVCRISTHAAVTGEERLSPNIFTPLITSPQENKR
jgi:hypothetical protein